MRVALTAPYADVRAADLVLALDAPPARPLEALQLRFGALTLMLGVLGHSHQIRLDGGELSLVETVACRPGAPGGLPGAHGLERAGHRYSFTATVEALVPAAADALARRVAADPLGLVGVFPGDGAAFTALHAHAVAGGVRWETWHAYPQSDELVRTTGTVQAA